MGGRNRTLEISVKNLVLEEKEEDSLKKNNAGEGKKELPSALEKTG